MARKPLVVFAGQFWPGATASGMAIGYRQAGYAVQEIDIRQFAGQSGESLASKIAHRVLKSQSTERYHRRILEDCKMLQPEIFMTVKGADLSPALLREIRSLGIITCNFYPDVDFNHQNTDPASLNEYDWFFTTKKFHLEPVGKQIGTDRVVHIPHGFVPDTHIPLSSRMMEEDYIADVSFAGNHSGYKQKFLEDLLERVPDLDLKLTGPNWAKNIVDSPLKSAHESFERFGFSFSDFLQRSRINVSIHYGQTKSGWEDAVSTRTFEIPACGGFMLHIDNDEVGAYFDIGKEIDVFSNPDELAEKISHYLDNPEKRKMMAREAHNRTLADHSCVHRVELMLSHINQRKSVESDKTRVPRD